MDNSEDLFEKVYDDVVVNILGYLPLNDKIKLEGVSKQWQRCMFNKQTVIKIRDDYAYDVEVEDGFIELLKPIERDNHRKRSNHSRDAMDYANLKAYKEIKRPELEYVLKKCKFIKSVVLDCYIDDTILKLIGRHLRGLESLECLIFGITKCGLLEFGRKFGQKLKQIRFGQTRDYLGEQPSIIDFLYYCPNLLKIDTEDQTKIIIAENDYLPKLEIIPHFKVGWNEEDVESVRILTKKYSESLKDLQLTVVCNHHRVLSYIKSLVNLQKLDLTVHFYSNHQNNEWNASDFIKSLSENCRKIKDLTFKLIGWYFGDYRNMFESFSKFTSIERIDIAIGTQQLIECKSQCFKHYTNLRHLILSYSQIRDEFFEHIDQHIPHLRSIDIETDIQLTDLSLISLSKLRKLKKVRLPQTSVPNELITDDGVCELINCCTRIEQIWFGRTVNITNATIDALKRIALQRPRIIIQFGFDLFKDRNEFGIQFGINRFENLPNNLKLNLPNQLIN